VPKNWCIPHLFAAGRCLCSDSKPGCIHDSDQGMASNPSLFHESVLHIVVAPAEMMFKLASKYKAFARVSRPNFHVVRNRDEAYQILAEAAATSGPKNLTADYTDSTDSH